MLGINDVQQLVGRTVYSTGGDKIGDIRQVYLNDRTEQPEFITVNTGLLGSNESFVPVAEVQVSDDSVTVPYDKDKVKNAPDVAPDGHISEAQEQELHAYYGLAAGSGHGDQDLSERDTTGSAGQQGTVGHDTSGPTTDEAMTRSEEQLRAGTRSQESGRARLRKWVETETETVTVPVEKEKAVLEREPVTEGNADAALDGPAISEEEHEVVLNEERVVVDKEATPVERVRLGKESVTDEQTVTDEVRKEQVEVEGDVDNR
jgi:uncharacterized protein (TIGR02271 family)